MGIVEINKIELAAALQQWRGFVMAKGDAFKVAYRQVLKVEVRRLVETLVNLAPPAIRGKTAKVIGERVEHKFSLLGQETNFQSLKERLTSNKSGHGAVKWYAWNPSSLYGMARDVDFTDATPEMLYKIYFESGVKSTGHRILGKRGKQTVYIRQKLATSPEARKALVNRLVNHLGRLKASLAIGLKQLPPMPSIPSWINRHFDGVRGSFDNNLKQLERPSATIKSHAKGVSSEKMTRRAKEAVDIRSKAMIKRMAFVTAHPERAAEEIG